MRARAARPLSSCGRETRAPSLGGASWAGMSACPSGLSVILSISLGTRKLRPLEARKRAERQKARRRVFVGRDDMAGPDLPSNAGATLARVPRAATAGLPRRRHRRGSGTPALVKGRSARTGVPGRALARYSLGVCANRLATAPRGGVLFPSPEAPGRRGRPPRGSRPSLQAGAPGSVTAHAASSRRWSTLPISIPRHQELDRPNGREAGLACRPW